MRLFWSSRLPYSSSVEQQVKWSYAWKSSPSLSSSSSSKSSRRNVSACRERKWPSFPLLEPRSEEGVSLSDEMYSIPGSEAWLSGTLGWPSCPSRRGWHLFLIELHWGWWAELAELSEISETFLSFWLEDELFDACDEPSSLTRRILLWKEQGRFGVLRRRGRREIAREVPLLVLGPTSPWTTRVLLLELMVVTHMVMLSVLIYLSKIKELSENTQARARAKAGAT